MMCPNRWPVARRRGTMIGAVHGRIHVRTIFSRHGHCFIGIVKTLITAAVILGALGFAASAPAASYFVDFASGSDSNNGLSTTAAWKRCPGMTGFAGNYSHVAGDRFLFKRGVTWTNCFPLVIGNGGTASSPDYYGTDPNWGSGLATFDFE